MAQPSITAFFNTRKRAIAEENSNLKTKQLLDGNETHSEIQDDVALKATTIASMAAGMRTRSGRTIVKHIGVADVSQQLQQQQQPVQQTDITGVSPRKQVKLVEESLTTVPEDRAINENQKLVQFIKMGSLSPRKKTMATPKVSQQQKINETTPQTEYTKDVLKDGKQLSRGLKTPTKQIIKGGRPLKQSDLKSLVKKELNFDEVKTKVTRSGKLHELKASLARIQELEKVRKVQEEKNQRLKDALQSPIKKAAASLTQLKEFDQIELEVLTSPSKTFKTPTKLPPPTPDKNQLLSPRHTNVSKRIQFSPSKNGSPSKILVPPAYQRFMSLAETSKAGQLPLPYKYRYLIEIFKGLDSVCAMFHNRKECITFKKLKPVVQRLLRKNFTETHLAQIKTIYPEAYIFTQMKMRNYGSTSKADYFQLVITPNLDNSTDSKQHQRQQRHLEKIDENDVLASGQNNIMKPQMLTLRLERLQLLLLQRVRMQHDEFLKALDPPLSIPLAKVTRWHPDFDLENCTDIELGRLPQPPNVDKYSSAKDILTTARNLFNCATPMEKALQRYEAKMLASKQLAEKTNTSRPLEVNKQHSKENIVEENKEKEEAQLQKEVKQMTTVLPVVNAQQKTVEAVVTENSSTTNTPKSISSNSSGSSNALNKAPPANVSNLLKGVPKSLLDKIRAKQAAKALDAMTRRPSQDQEAVKYSRLPELARYVRNIFISERKGVLTMDTIMAKIQNSFRTCLTKHEIENHLQLMSKEVPSWMSFHEVRKTMYLKINREMDLIKIIERLETVANEKSKM